MSLAEEYENKCPGARAGWRESVTAHKENALAQSYIQMI
jgi:hypothetical protein